MSKQFRIQSCDFSVTWAKVGKDFNKEQLMEHLKRLLDDKWSYIGISMELHKDNTEHFHGHIQFHKTYNLTKNTLFNFFGHQASIEKTKGSGDWNTYIKKDGNFIESGEFQLLTIPKNKKIVKEKLTNKQLIEGDLLELVQAEKISLREYGVLKKAKKELLKDMEFAALPKKEDKPDLVPNPWEILLDISQDPKKRHLWIFSVGTGYGKSTFINELESRFKTCRLVVKENFQSPTIESADFILIDGNHKVDYADLETMCDGRHSYPIKYGGVAVNFNKPTIVVCTNGSMMDKHPHKHAILTERFIEFDLAEIITIDPKLYWANKTNI